jgi:hypothetical protein
MLMMHGLGFGLGAANYGAGPAIGTTGEVGWNDYGTPPPPPKPPTGGGGGIPTTCPTGYVLSAKGCVVLTATPPPMPGSTNPMGTRQPGQPAVPTYRCANGAMVTNPRLCAFGIAPPDEVKPSAGSPPGSQVNPVAPVDGSGMHRTCPDGTVVGAGGSCPPTPMTTKSKKGLILGVLAAGAGIAALAFFNR